VNRPKRNVSSYVEAGSQILQQEDDDIDNNDIPDYRAKVKHAVRFT
jgi:hypothetical protein